MATFCKLLDLLLWLQFTAVLPSVQFMMVYTAGLVNTAFYNTLWDTLSALSIRLIISSIH